MNPQTASPTSTVAVIEKTLDSLLKFPSTREFLLSAARKCDFDEPLSNSKLNKLADKLIKSLTKEESCDHSQN